jgi:L-glyceraldehyde 3-phosphate reductase
LGLWQNFGGYDPFETARAMLHKAFDLGITHFDLANNYGPPYGSAEANFGRILKDDLAVYRDELIISTKAGFDMWPGPYGDWGSRKYLVASLDQSLQRMGLDYVDIFYHHRPDPETPLAETMSALDYIVRSGKALYVGISNYYSTELTQQASQILRDLGTPCLIHQPRYNIMDRRIENGLLQTLQSEGIGCIPFSVLNQGILSDKYLGQIPEGSRIAKAHTPMEADRLTDQLLHEVSLLNDIALARGQSLAQMALAWVLRNESVTTALCGASRPEQIEDSVKVLSNLDFSSEELVRIDHIVT